MESKLLAGIMGVVVLVTLLGAFAVPTIMSVAETTTTTPNDSPEWMKLSLVEGAVTANYNFTIALSEGQATVGTQSGTADDMIVYADDDAALLIRDGSLLYIYDDNGAAATAALGNSVTVSNALGTTTVTDGVTTLTKGSPEWAYYPNASGTYRFFTHGDLMTYEDNHLAALGTFAITAYNTLVSDGIELEMDADVEEERINSVNWIQED